jgi:hypothetical protein
MPMGMPPRNEHVWRFSRHAQYTNLHKSIDSYPVA